MTSFEEIAAAAAPPEAATAAAPETIELTVPEWDGATFRLRSLGPDQHAAIEPTLARHARWDARRAETLYRAAIVAASAVDDRGRPLFVGASRRAFLESRDLDLLRRISAAVLDHSGIADPLASGDPTSAPEAP